MGILAVVLLAAVAGVATFAALSAAHSASSFVLRVGFGRRPAASPAAAAASPSRLTPSLGGPAQGRIREASAATQAAAFGFGAAAAEAEAEETADWWRTPKATPSESRWDLWPALPIAPFDRRVTMMREVIPGEMWTFEQKQGILYVHVPIRMTVYRMQSRRGLFVYAPVAPTDELVAMLRELEERHGEVAYIVLPTVAVEHKYFVGPFARAFRKAEVWVCPGQFSVPVQLPLVLLGFPGGERLRILPLAGAGGWEPPEDWAREGIEFRILGPIGKDVANGAFAEVAFYLRRLKTMLVTDLLVSVPTEIPAIIAEDPRALVFHARDGPTSAIETSPEAMSRGWRRIALFALFFQSSAIDAQPVADAVRDAFASQAKDLGWGGLLPWTFVKQWESSFASLRGPLGMGGLVVAPILSELILNRYVTSDVWPFVEDISRSWWDMERVIPAHFEGPVSARASDVRDAFRRAFGEPPGPLQGLGRIFGPWPGPRPKLEDLSYLRNASDFLAGLGIINPAELTTYS